MINVIEKADTLYLNLTNQGKVMQNFTVLGIRQAAQTGHLDVTAEIIDMVKVKYKPAHNNSFYAIVALGLTLTE